MALGNRTASPGGLGGLGTAILVVQVVLIVANYIFVIWSIFDTRNHPSGAWTRAQQNESLWRTLTLVSLCVGGWVIAFVYVLAVRPRLMAAERGEIPASSVPPRVDPRDRVVAPVEPAVRPFDNVRDKRKPRDP